MARDTSQLSYRTQIQATALVGIVGLSLLPVAVQAQQLPMPASPAPARTLSAPPILSRPGGPTVGSGYGLPGGYRPLPSPQLPNYGSSPGYRSPYFGIDFNPYFQRPAYGPNGYGASPYAVRNPGQTGDSPNLPTPRRNVAGNGTYGPPLQSPTIQHNTGIGPGRRTPTHEDYAYRYHNANWGRGEVHHYPLWASVYFPSGSAYYPYYCPDYAFGLVVPSVYYYYGTFPPYIGMNDVYNAPPDYGLVPSPTYSPDGQYTGAQGDGLDGYYLNRPQNDQSGQDGQDGQKSATTGYKVGESQITKDSLLNSAVSDIQGAWKSGDIQQLSTHVREGSRVAIYLRGKYQYSLDAGDYLDITRDAFRATTTVSFTLDNVERKQNGIYTVTGRHVYQDKGGKSHTVVVNYVLEKMGDDYYITQVGTAPEKLEE